VRILSAVIVLMLAILQPAFSLAGEKEEAMGKVLYMRYCMQCHGDKGLGNGENVLAAEMDPVPRDLCDIEKPYMKNKDNDYLIRAIAEGGLGIDKSSLMPRFHETLSTYEIATVAAFIRTLHKHAAPPVDFSKVKKDKVKKITVSKIDASNAGKREKLMGKKVYKKYGCSGCHSIKGRGGATGGDLTTIGSKHDPQKLWQIIKSPASINEKTEMPAYNIDDDTGTILVKYLSSLKE
jgi:mono/diheme cytochrome c family protein|tara:strand:- start:868 stop:1575 length:708 start_codon:yes stop_codon:yes gene_type:complete